MFGSPIFDLEKPRIDVHAQRSAGQRDAEQ
jgi:hypothetical protein